VSRALATGERTLHTDTPHLERARVSGAALPSNCRFARMALHFRAGCAMLKCSPSGRNGNHEANSDCQHSLSTGHSSCRRLQHIPPTCCHAQDPPYLVDAN
jgi:hypothetical protein